MKKVIYSIITISLIFVLSGCSESETMKLRNINRSKAIESCLNNDGVPILEYNDLVDCKFKEMK